MVIKKILRAIGPNKPTLEELELERLVKESRYTAGETSLMQNRLRYVDAASFLAQFQEIWVREIYSVPESTTGKVILDCGANIGLATLYFATHFPNATISAFEPDPVVFDALRRNCESWAVQNVTLHNTAVWIDNVETLPFEMEGADSGSLRPTSNVTTHKMIEVKCSRLRTVIEAEPVYLLKIDIEGSEEAVLNDCRDVLQNVENLFVEYHSFEGKPQQLHRVLEILSGAGFRTHLEAGLVSMQPFMRRQNYNGMDQVINIFAFRN